MIELRSEPQGGAFLDLLREGHSRQLSAGFIVQTEPPSRWTSFFSARARSRLTRTHPGGLAVDPVSAVEFDLDSQAQAVIFEIFAGRLFGPEGGVWAQDLFIAEGIGDPSPFLSTTSSECYAGVGVAMGAWLEIVDRRQALRKIPVTERGIRFIDEPGANLLLFDLRESSATEKVGLLAEALAAALGSYVDASKAVVAAYLVGETIRPDLVGDIGWRLAGGAPQELAIFAKLAPQAVRTIDSVGNYSPWRGRWAGYGVLSAAREELAWLRSVLSAGGVPVDSQF